jgi:hypothetical protein
MSEYRVVSNYTMLQEFEDETEARLFALDQSWQYDDRVTIEAGVRITHLAVHGQLYRVMPVQPPKPKGKR